ncbi:MAG: hypothetical protein N3A38_15640 [Planctomycetota bacterium]|nr:hypothetical protein [Planctomycetota bacterium]
MGIIVGSGGNETDWLLHGGRTSPLFRSLEPAHLRCRVEGPIFPIIRRPFDVNYVETGRGVEPRDPDTDKPLTPAQVQWRDYVREHIATHREWLTGGDSPFGGPPRINYEVLPAGHLDVSAQRRAGTQFLPVGMRVDAVKG